MNHRIGPGVCLEIHLSHSFGSPTKLITMKASSHHSLAADIRRDSKRKPTIDVLRNRKVTLKPIKSAALLIILNHEKIACLDP